MTIRFAAVLLTSAMLLAAGDPVKIAVSTPAKSLGAGDEVQIEVALEDVAGQPAPAPKPLAVSIDSRSPDGSVARLGTVTFAPGEQVKRARYRLPNSGLQYLWARHAELLGGGTFVKVSAGNASGPSPATGRRPFAPAAPAPPPPRPTLALRYSPQRPLLANGQERATIQAFLVGEDSTAASDIHIRLANSTGRLEPAPLVIPHGGDYGESELTSDEAGTALVEYMSSNPPLTVDGDRQLKIEFDPPVSTLAASASPPLISLVDSAEIIVRLADGDGRPVPCALERKVAFSITSGRGVIDPEETAIRAGGFEARASLRPYSSGHIVVAVSTPNLLVRTAEFDVRPPWLLLGLAALGGIAGGWLAVKERHRKPWHIAGGALTGFLLYWALLFGLLPVLPRLTILNPLSAAAISAVGGWGGSQVLKALWKRLVPA